MHASSAMVLALGVAAYDEQTGMLQVQGDQGDVPKYTKDKVEKVVKYTKAAYGDHVDVVLPDPVWLTHSEDPGLVIRNCHVHGAKKCSTFHGGKALMDSMKDGTAHYGEHCCVERVKQCETKYVTHCNRQNAKDLTYAQCKQVAKHAKSLFFQSVVDKKEQFPGCYYRTADGKTFWNAFEAKAGYGKGDESHGDRKAYAPICRVRRCKNSKTDYKKVVHPKGYKKVVHPKGYKKVVHPKAYRKAAHPKEYRKAAHPKEYRKSAHPKQYRKSAHPKQYRKAAHPKQYRKERTKQHKKVQHPKAYQKVEHRQGYKKVDEPKYEKVQLALGVDQPEEAAMLQLPRSYREHPAEYTKKHPEEYRQNTRQAYRQNTRQAYRQSTRQAYRTTKPERYTKEHPEQHKKVEHPKQYEKMAHPKAYKKVTHPKAYKKMAHPKAYKKMAHPKAYKKVTHPKAYKKVAHPKAYKKVAHPKAYKKVEHRQKYKKVDKPKYKKVQELHYRH